VCNARRDGLALARTECSVYRGIRRHRESNDAVDDAQQRPDAFSDAVVATQSRRKGLVVERPDGPHDVEPCRHFAAVAQRAVHRRADVLSSASIGEHPRTLEERRLMTDMLIVQTGQLSDPITMLVLVEAINRPDHGHTVAPARSGVTPGCGARGDIRRSSRPKRSTCCISRAVRRMSGGIRCASIREPTSDPRAVGQLLGALRTR
jgi:hypothetical protein